VLSLKQAVGYYTISRAFIALVLFLTLSIQLFPEPFGETTIRHPFLTLPGGFSGFREILTLGDSTWYASIAESGYTVREFSNTKDENWAFFPLLPILERLLNPLFSDFYLSGLAIASLCNFLAFFLLYELMQARGYSEDITSRALLFLAFFPTTYFLALPLTESLLLTLGLAAFLAAEKDRPLLAGIFLGLAGASRPSGLLMVPALLFVWLRKEGSFNALFKVRYIFASAISTLGAAAFMVHLYNISGNPLAFLDIQSRWGRRKMGLFELLGSIPDRATVMIEDWNFVILNLLAIALSVTATIYFLKRKEFDFATIIALPILSALNTGTTLSCHRFVVTLFPIFIFLAVITKSRNSERLVLGISVFLLTVLLILLALHTTAAMA